MIERLVAALWAGDEDVDWRQVADILWLAHKSPATSRAGTGGTAATAADAAAAPAATGGDAVTGSQAEPAARVAVPSGDVLGPARARAPGAIALDLRPPAAAALPGRLEIARALRPFKQRRPSTHDEVFDTELTIEHYCDTRVLVPITTPARERWFQEVALVVDEGPTMVVWRETVAALAELLAHHGAFERVTSWALSGGATQVELVSPVGLRLAPAALLDYGARRLTLVVTDCTGPMWHGSAAWHALQLWGRFAPVALVAMLPPRLWPATALGAADVIMSSHRPGEPNALLRSELPWWWDADVPPDDPIPIPVVTLDERRLAPWAQMVMGGDGVAAAGVLARPPDPVSGAPKTAVMSAEDRVAAFRATVSLEASRLATLLSAVDVSLPVARLILDSLIEDGRQLHLAEVLASGLLRPRSPAPESPGEQRYDFVEGVRAVLQESVTMSETFAVWRAVAPYLERATGRRPPFSRLLVADAAVAPGATPLDTIAAELIERLGLRELLGSVIVRQEILATDDARATETAEVAAEEPGPDEVADDLRRYIRSCVRVFSAGRLVTGYFVGSDQVVTTSLIQSRDDLAVEWQGMRLTAAETVIAGRITSVRLGEPVPDGEPLVPAPRDDVAEGAAWTAIGFADAAETAQAIAGVVRDGQYVIESLPPSQRLAGIAGAPVLVDGYVVAQVEGVLEGERLVVVPLSAIRWALTPREHRAELPVRALCVYARDDEASFDELADHLGSFAGLIELEKLEQRLGEDWSGYMSRAVEEADLVLVLVSPQLLVSEYPGVSAQTRIVPILLRPARWEDTPLGRIQALPSNGQPIDTWRDRSAAWADVEEGIRRLVGDMRGAEPKRQSPPPVYSDVLDRIASEAASTDPTEALLLSGGRPLLDRTPLRASVRALLAGHRRILVVNGPPRSGKSYSAEFIAHVAEQFEPDAPGLFRVARLHIDAAVAPTYTPWDLAAELAARMGEALPLTDPGSDDGPRALRELVDRLVFLIPSQERDWWIVLDGLAAPGLPPQIPEFVGLLAERIAIDAVRGVTRLVLLDFPSTLPERVLSWVEQEYLDDPASVGAEDVREYLRRLSQVIGYEMDEDAIHSATSMIVKDAPDGPDRLPYLASRVVAVAEMLLAAS